MPSLTAPASKSHMTCRKGTHARLCDRLTSLHRCMASVTIGCLASLLTQTLHLSCQQPHTAVTTRPAHRTHLKIAHQGQSIDTHTLNPTPRHISGLPSQLLLLCLMTQPEVQRSAWHLWLWQPPPQPLTQLSLSHCLLQ